MCQYIQFFAPPCYFREQTGECVVRAAVAKIGIGCPWHHWPKDALGIISPTYPIISPRPTSRSCCRTLLGNAKWAFILSYKKSCWGQVAPRVLSDHLKSLDWVIWLNQTVFKIYISAFMPALHPPVSWDCIRAQVAAFLSDLEVFCFDWWN